MSILIACGLKREATLLGGPGVVAIPGGGDAARLEAALEAAAGSAGAIVSAGIAGAFAPQLRVGDIVIGEHIIGHGATDPALAARLASALPGAMLGPIKGGDQIWARAADKAAMFGSTRALAADMESHVAARVAARHNLPLAVVRVISDSAAEDLPPAALVGMKPDGGMALGAVLRSLARRPTQLPALIRTGRHAEVAFQRLRAVAEAIARLS